MHHLQSFKKKAFSLSAKLNPANHVIQNLRVELVPCWLNLELGVLIRLWELVESSTGSYGQSRIKGCVALADPQPAEGARPDHRVIWRLMKLQIEPLELAIHMRSPDKRVLTDNRVPWWIMHLPLDMSNMLLSVPDVQLLDRFGSINQLVSSVRTTYTKHIKMSALKSVVIFYFGNS